MAPSYLDLEVAREEEDQEIDAWQARVQEQKESKAEFFSTWTRGSGLLSRPPRRRGRGRGDGQ